MSSNAARSNKKFYGTLKGFVQKPQVRFFLCETPKVYSFFHETPKVYSFFHETFLGLARNFKRFRGKGFDCAHVKNLSKFRRIFLLLLSAFELIWKLFPSTEPVWWVQGKSYFFLECESESVVRLSKLWHRCSD